MFRLPAVPDQPSTAIGTPLISIAAATAPGQALGSLAQTIGGVSDAFSKEAVRIQRMENARIASEARRGLAESFSAFQLELANDPDPESRITRTRDFLATAKGNLVPAGAAPIVEDELTNHFEKFASQAVIAQAADSSNLTRKRTGLALQSEFADALNTRNRGEAERVLDSAIGAGILLPEEKTAKLRDFDREVKIGAIGEMIQQDAFTAADELRTKDFQTRHPELSGDDIARLTERAEVEKRRQTSDDIDTLEDGIASGSITAPEQIDGMAEHIRPAVRETLKATLAKRQSALHQIWLARPEVQQRLIGEANTAISAYDPAHPEEFDTNLARIHETLDQVAPGAVKDELTRRLREVREGRLAERKTALDMAIDSLETAFKSGAFGGGKPDDGERTLPTSRAIADGFLRDKAKLESFGFTAEQIAEMEAEAAGEADALKGTPTWQKLSEAARKARQADAMDKARASWFTRNWNARDKSKNPDDPAAAAVAEAIANGETAAKWTDYEAAAVSARRSTEAQQRKGDAVQSLIQWHRQHPEATEKELGDKLMDFAGKPARQAFLRSRIAPPPTGTAGPSLPIPPEGIKLSNYGYASDSTPDSNSAKGIGHADNKLENEVSAAVSKSLADRIGLKPGDRFLIETTRGSRIVRYDDTVPASDPRTGPLPETIDIYRPKEGSNKWSGRVIAIRKL